MHLRGTRLTEHRDDRLLGVAPHDRVVNDHQPLTCDRVP